MANTILKSAMALAAAFAGAPVAQAKTVAQFSTGVNYSSGKYGGTSKTDVVVAPFAAKVKTGNWSFRASLPYLYIDGPSNVTVIDDGGGVSPVDSGNNVVRNSSVNGIGDLSLTATYTFKKILGDSSYLDASGRVRLPTGNDKKGLGSGATDFIAKGELGWAFENSGIYFSGGRRFLGDANGVNRKDGWQAGAGAWLNPTKKTTIGAYYDWRESATGLSDDPSEVGVFTSYRLTKEVKIGLDAGAGLSDGSPDYSVGLAISWRPDFDRR